MRGRRSDAQLNHDRLLAAAAGAISERGYAVPMAEIARRAGVGVGTLYRHFPGRDELLTALASRGFELVLARARAVADDDGPAIDAVGRFFAETIASRSDLLLPLHGSPARLNARSRRMQREIRGVLAEVLERGRADGTIRDDVDAREIVLTAAHLAQPLANVSDWDRIARRQAEIYLAGLHPRTTTPPVSGDPRGTDGRG